MDYVGHTARLRSRIREHRNGEVRSTVGGQPELAWYAKRPFRTRVEAASFEAALKALKAKAVAEVQGDHGAGPDSLQTPDLFGRRACEFDVDGGYGGCACDSSHGDWTAVRVVLESTEGSGDELGGRHMQRPPMFLLEFLGMGLGDVMV